MPGSSLKTARMRIYALATTDLKECLQIGYDCGRKSRKSRFGACVAGKKTINHFRSSYIEVVVGGKEEEEKEEEDREREKTHSSVRGVLYKF